MSSSEKFCLRWNDFESNISVAFREIREEKDFFDCTLSVGTRQIQAHKLILSACSPFFRSILRQNPHQHPLLYLKGVEFTDLQAVLNFMYHGEVNVAQEELNSFLAVAEDLKVKGLTQNSSADNSSSAPSKPKSEPAPSSLPRPRPSREVEDPPKRPRPIVPAPAPSYQHQDDDDDIQEVMPVVKQEPQTVVADPLPTPHQPMAAMSQVYQPQTDPTTHTMHQTNTVAQIDESYGEDGYDYGGYGEEDPYEGAMMDTSAGGDQNKGSTFFTNMEEMDNFIDENISSGTPTGWVCCLCGRSAVNRLDIKRHIESKHCGTPGFSCDVTGCEAQLHKTRHSLATHKRLKHNITESNSRKHFIYHPN